MAEIIFRLSLRPSLYSPHLSVDYHIAAIYSQPYPVAMELQISQQHSNRNLPNSRNINRRPFLYPNTIKILLTRKINTNRSLANQLRRKLITRRRHPRNNNITLRSTILECEIRILDFVFAEFYACAAMILLDTRDVDGEDFCAVVSEEGGEGTADDFAAVDDCYCAAVETVAVGEDGVVCTEVFENLDVRQSLGGEDTFITASGVHGRMAFLVFASSNHRMLWYILFIQVCDNPSTSFSSSNTTVTLIQNPAIHCCRY